MYVINGNYKQLKARRGELTRDFNTVSSMGFGVAQKLDIGLGFEVKFKVDETMSRLQFISTINNLQCIDLLRL